MNEGMDIAQAPRGKIIFILATHFQLLQQLMSIQKRLQKHSCPYRKKISKTFIAFDNARYSLKMKKKKEGN